MFGINNIDALMAFNTPDIAEKTEFGYYLGYFAPKTDETMTDNCIIIEMRQVGDVTTRKFAQGENVLFRLTWAERRNYEYKFKLKEF